MPTDSAKYAYKNILGGGNNEYIEVVCSNDPLNPIPGTQLVKEAKEVALTGLTRVGPARPTAATAARALSAPTTNPAPASRTSVSNAPTSRGSYGGGANRAPRTFVDPDWSTLPVQVELSGVRGDDFNFAKDFLKQNGFQWNKNAKVWQGGSVPMYPSSLAFLEDRTKDTGANGFDQDSLPDDINFG